MDSARSNSPQSQRSEEDAQERIFVANGRPVFFYLYGTNEPDSDAALKEREREQLFEAITQHGGQVTDAERDAETIIVNELGVAALSKKYEFNRTPYVEMPSFVWRCIAQGRYEHKPVMKMPLSGRHTGRSRMNFTHEDDMNLCRWIANTMPHPVAGGRHGIKPYLALVEKAQYNDLDYKWAARHPADSWRQRYKTQQHRFDPIIAAMVKENPPPADGKGVWPYDRRVNNNSVYARISRLNAMAQWQGEEEAEPREAQMSLSPEPVDLGQAASDHERREHNERLPVGYGPPRASASSVEQARGRVHSAPYSGPSRAAEWPGSMSKEEKGEFADSDMDDVDDAADDGHRPGPEDGGPSMSQRTPSASPPRRPAQPPERRASRQVPSGPREGAKRVFAAPAASQVPMSSQATLVGPVPTQLRGAPSAAKLPSAAPARARHAAVEIDDEDGAGTGAKVNTRAGKRRRIQPVPEPPAVQPAPLRKTGLGARSAPRKANDVARPTMAVAKAGPSTKRALKAPMRAEAQEEEDGEQGAEGDLASIGGGRDGDTSDEDIEINGMAVEEDVFAPQSNIVGPTLEEEWEVEELVQATAEATGNASLSETSEVLDSDDERSRQKLLPSRPPIPPPSEGNNRTSSHASRSRRLVDHLAQTADDELFAHTLDLVGPAPRRHPVTPLSRPTPKRQGTVASSTSSIPDVPLPGTRASEEKRRARESERFEPYVPPPGSRAASAQKMQLRSGLTIQRG